MDDIIIHYIREHNKNKNNNTNTNTNNKYEGICILEENLLKTCLNKSHDNDLCNIYEKIYFDCKKFKNRKIKK